jgi:hypothetical protein
MGFGMLRVKPAKPMLNETTTKAYLEFFFGEWAYSEAISNFFNLKIQVMKIVSHNH